MIQCVRETWREKNKSKYTEQENNHSGNNTNKRSQY